MDSSVDIVMYRFISGMCLFIKSVFAYFETKKVTSLRKKKLSSRTAVTGFLHCHQDFLLLIFCVEDSVIKNEQHTH